MFKTFIQETKFNLTNFLQVSSKKIFPVPTIQSGLNTKKRTKVGQNQNLTLIQIIKLGLKMLLIRMTMLTKLGQLHKISLILAAHQNGMKIIKKSLTKIGMMRSLKDLLMKKITSTVQNKPLIMKKG